MQVFKVLQFSSTAFELKIAAKKSKNRNIYGGISNILFQKKSSARK
jgi:hypothetical protein